MGWSKAWTAERHLGVTKAMAEKIWALAASPGAVRSRAGPQMCRTPMIAADPLKVNMPLGPHKGKTEAAPTLTVSGKLFHSCSLVHSTGACNGRSASVDWQG